MKKYSFLLALLCIASTRANTDFDDCCFRTINKDVGFPCANAIDHQGPCNCNDQFSKLFMFTRTINQDLVVTFALEDFLIHNKKGDFKASFDITPVYQKSQPFNRDAHYFLPNCKDSELVSGDAVTSSISTRDIRAEWLGLPSNFSGHFSLCPEQEQFGIIIDYNQDLGTLLEISLFERTWIDISLPVVVVTSNINVHQFDLANADQGCPGNIVAALQQKDWRYAKFVGSRTAMQVAEINIKLGQTFMHGDDFLIAYYSMLSIPTGHSRNPAVIFDPIAGYYGHWGLGGGVNFQLPLNRDTSVIAACFFLDLESLFLIRSTETRTFDLVNKPWSRYLLLTNKQGPLGNTVPGVNVLTQQVRVHPYGIADCALGLRFKTRCVEIEVGYDIWGHAEERIELLCQFPNNFGIAGDPTGVNPADLPFDVYSVTASRSTISAQAPIDKDPDGKPRFAAINAGDLDLHSASSQHAIVNKAFASIGFFKEGTRLDGAFGFGFFFDFPQFNAALKLVGAWAKLGAAF